MKALKITITGLKKMIDIEKERVEFERSSDLQLNSGDLAYKDSKGNYIDRDIKIQWKAWLAAKESAQKEIDQLEIIYKCNKCSFENTYNQLIKEQDENLNLKKLKS